MSDRSASGLLLKPMVQRFTVAPEVDARHGVITASMLVIALGLFIGFAKEGKSREFPATFGAIEHSLSRFMFRLDLVD